MDMEINTMNKHKDIGRRVKWTNRGETGYGTLMAVDCDRYPITHLVQREDGKGWKLEACDNKPWFQSAREQGVEDGVENLNWVSSYEVVEPQFKRGDKVLVWNKDESKAEPRTYLATIEGANFPHLCVIRRYEERFQAGERFSHGSWKHIKPLPESPKDKWLKEGEKEGWVKDGKVIS